MIAILLLPEVWSSGIGPDFFSFLYPLRVCVGYAERNEVRLIIYADGSLTGWPWQAEHSRASIAHEAQASRADRRRISSGVASVNDGLVKKADTASFSLENLSCQVTSKKFSRIPSSAR